MENKRTGRLILMVFALIGFSACGKLDVGNMFVSDTTANERFLQSESWNAIHPFKEIIVTADDYTIFTMSDSHVGETKNFDDFLNLAKIEDVAAVAMAGDLTTGNADDYEVFQQHLALADSLNIFPIAGNHDLYFNGWEQFYSRFGSSSYLFKVKTPVATDLFICLESGSGTLGSKQLDWLKNTLENERASYRRCIVITHDNFFRFRHTTSTNPMVEELAVLTDLFTRYNVDMVIMGHDHEQDAETFGNTSYIVMDALVDDNPNAGFLRVHIKDGIIEYKFEKL